MPAADQRTDPFTKTTQHARPAFETRRGAMSPLLSVASAAAIIPFALVFGAGVLAWGVSRDLQRTCVVRVPGVRRVLVWVGGDVRREGGNEQH